MTNVYNVRFFSLSLYLLNADNKHLTRFYRLHILTESCIFITLLMFTLFVFTTPVLTDSVSPAVSQFSLICEAVLAAHQTVRQITSRLRHQTAVRVCQTAVRVCQTAVHVCQTAVRVCQTAMGVSQTVVPVRRMPADLPK